MHILCTHSIHGQYGTVESLCHRKAVWKRPPKITSCMWPKQECPCTGSDQLWLYLPKSWKLPKIKVPQPFWAVCSVYLCVNVCLWECVLPPNGQPENPRHPFFGIVPLASKWIWLQQPPYYVLESHRQLSLEVLAFLLAGRTHWNKNNHISICCNGIIL